jgi:signal transduction histidine kinase
LIDNALDAIEMEKDRTEPGQLRIETKQELDQILVEITDNGPGIPDTVASKIFDPFFTTKEQGDGTGLGLDTVYRIIRQHEGDIRFQSAPGKTTFSVRLPIPRPA